MFEEIRGCRICGDGLEEVLDLGELYPSTFVDGPEEHYYGNPVIQKAPLVLVECQRCGLIQLKHTVELDSMYRQYWYKSGLNNSMVESLQDIVEEVQRKIRLIPGDVVIDIGANDGTMLSMYPDYVTKIGIDPALNLAEEAEKHCDYFVNDYFSAGVIPRRYPKAKVITSIAMFYDLPNPVAFVDDITQLLAPGGIWIIQLTDLMGMLETNAFDNNCHEHLEYYSLDVIVDLLYKQGLEVFDLTYNRTNGRSIRLYISWIGSHKVWPHVKVALRGEREYLRNNALVKFAGRVEEIRKITCKFLEDHSEDTIFAMGASTKGNTLLQYFGITNEQIAFAVEINPDKYGKYTIGSNIPIIPQGFIPDKLKYPDYYFVLPWHFIDNFIEKEQKFLEQGGRFFIPLPWPCEIYLKDGEEIWEWKEKQLENCSINS
jgi:hypothetical protein